MADLGNLFDFDDDDDKDASTVAEEPSYTRDTKIKSHRVWGTNNLVVDYQVSEEDKKKREEQAVRTKEAIDFLDTDEFDEIWKRTSLEKGEDLSNLSKTELIRHFYDSQLFANYNTVGMYQDYDAVAEGSGQYKDDWAKLQNLWYNLPSFGNKQIGFWKWATTVIPSITYQDPLFWASWGWGAIIGQPVKGELLRQTKKKILESAAKGHLKTSPKEMLTKLDNMSNKEIAAFFTTNFGKASLDTIKKEALNIGLKSGIKTQGTIGLGLGAYADTHKQWSEMAAGVGPGEFDYERLLESMAAVSLLNIGVGAPMTAWGSKGTVGNYVKDKGQFWKDLNKELGDWAATTESSWNVKNGKLISVEPTTKSTNVGDTVTLPNKKMGQIISSNNKGQSKVKLTDAKGISYTETVPTKNLTTVLTSEPIPPEILEVETSVIKAKANAGDPFTIHYKTHEPKEDGFTTAISKHTEYKLKPNEKIETYMNAILKDIQEVQKYFPEWEPHYGGWADADGTFTFDISFNFPNKADAIYAATASKRSKAKGTGPQDAIWDHVGMTEISTSKPSVAIAKLKKEGIYNKKRHAEIVDRIQRYENTSVFHNPKLHSNEPRIMLKPDETAHIVEYVQTHIFNESKIDASPEVIQSIKNVMMKAVEDGHLRKESRQGLLETIRKEGIQISRQEHSKIMDDIEKRLADMKNNPSDAALAYSTRIKIIQLAHQVRELKKLRYEAATPAEQNALAESYISLFDDWSEAVVTYFKLMESASDTLQSGKIVAGQSTADDLILQAAKASDMATVKKAIDDLDANKKIETIDRLLENFDGMSSLHRLIDEAKYKSKEDNVSLAAALNEMVTANLLWDVSTHQTNTLALIAMTPVSVAEQYMASLTWLSKGEFDLARGQFNMANDYWGSMFSVLQSSWIQAERAWLTKRAVGDHNAHKLDQTKLNMMELKAKEYLQSDYAPVRWAGHGFDKIGSFIYNSFRALAVEDSLFKNITQQAMRVSHVMEIMRKNYPELYKVGRQNKNKKNALLYSEASNQINLLKNKLLDYKVIHQTSLHTEKRKAKIAKMEANIEAKEVALRKQFPDINDFTTKFNEIYMRYQDEFGNFRDPIDWTPEERSILTTLTQSQSYAPKVESQHISLTTPLRSPVLEKTPTNPNQNPSNYNLGAWATEQLNENPFLRITFSTHFLKIPVNLIKYFWQSAPGLQYFNVEFLTKLRSPDPVVRNQARARQAVGALAFAGFMFLAKEEKITPGNHPDPQKRYSFKSKVMKTVDKGKPTEREVWTGEYTYIPLARFPNLTGLAMIAADINQAQETLTGIQNDPTYRHEQDMIVEMLTHARDSAISIYSKIFESNMMTRDAFQLFSIWFGANKDLDDANLTSSKLEKYLDKQAGKFVPLATGWRFTNREMSLAQYELHGITEELAYSSPYQLLKKLNNLTGNPISEKNFSEIAMPKRDILGNVLPSKGGWWGTPMPTTEALSSRMLDSNNEPLKFSVNGIRKLQDSELYLEYQRIPSKLPFDTFEFVNITLPTFGNSLNLKETLIVKANKIEDGEIVEGEYIDYPEGQNMYDTLMHYKNNVKITSGGDALTLNERIHREIEDPDSKYNLLFRDNRQISGKREGASYLASVIRLYDARALELLKAHVTFKSQGDETTFNDLVNVGENIIKQLYPHR